ncbi:hypothetical protein C8R43DRAFT_213788 [Mycena crocata]|nr:hypothetical protein C8R43DRAFT_213788 [Mycena crocata]
MLESEIEMRTDSPASGHATLETNVEHTARPPPVQQASADVIPENAIRYSSPIPTPPADARMPTPNEEEDNCIVTMVTPSDIIIKNEPADIELISDMPEPRPEKRRRVFMEAVVIPERPARTREAADRSSAQSREETDAERQEIHRKLEQLHNPIVKKPKNMPTLSLDTIRERLQNIGYEPRPIDLDKAILDVTTRRDFMSKEYGGNPQETYPTIAEHFVEKTSLAYFMYLNLLHNPHAPEVPGAPGLLFDALCKHEWEDRVKAEEEKEKKEKKKGITKVTKKQEVEGEILFSRLASATWQYQGQYALGPAPPLTIAEWKQQPPQVRKKWTTELSKKGWGRSIRADITLRRQLRKKPTRAQTTRALNSKDKFHNVTPEEIGRAFDRGDVLIMVQTLKCIGYHADLQQNVAAKMPFFVPKPKKARTKQTPHKVGDKRKREDSESESDPVDDSDVPESEDEELDEPVYRSRGTRSRPIII